MPFPSYLTSKNSLRQQVSHRNTFLSCAFVVLTLWEVNVPDAVIAGRIKTWVRTVLKSQVLRTFYSPSPGTVDSLSFRVLLCFHQPIIRSFFLESQWEWSTHCAKPVCDRLQKTQRSAGAGWQRTTVRICCGPCLRWLEWCLNPRGSWKAKGSPRQTGETG